MISRPVPESVFRFRPDVVFRYYAPEGLLVRQSGAEIVVVNEVGARVVKLLDGSRTLAAVVQQMVDEYQVTPQQLHADVAAFVAELADAQLIESV